MAGKIPLTAGGHNMGRLEIVGRGDGGSASSKIAVLAGLVEDLEFALGTTAGLVPSVASPSGEAGGVALAPAARANDDPAAASVATETAARVENGNGHTVAWEWNSALVTCSRRRNHGSTPLNAHHPGHLLRHAHRRGRCRHLRIALERGSLRDDGTCGASLITPA